MFGQFRLGGTLLLLVTLLLLGCKGSRDATEAQSEPEALKELLSKQKNLIRECPEAWIVNQMPRVEDSTDDLPREYLVYEGKRVELAAADTTWILQNCEVRKEVVF